MSSTTTSDRAATTSGEFSSRYFSVALRERVGRRDQLRRRCGCRCASSSPATPPTGSTSSISTGCGSTRRSRSSTPRQRTSCAEIAAARARGRRTAIDHHRRGERAAGCASAAAARRRRLRPRRAVERRLPPRRGRRADRPSRGLLHRLSRHAAGVHLARPSAASSIQGQRYSWQKQAPRHADARLSPAALHHVSRESRSGRQFAHGPWRAPLRSSPVRRCYRAHDGAVAAVARHADVLPRTGIRGVGAFMYFADHQRRARRGGARGRARIHEPIPQRGDARSVDALPSPGGETLRTLQSWTAGAPQRTRRCSRCIAISCALRRERSGSHAAARVPLRRRAVSAHAFVLRWFRATPRAGEHGGDDRLLVVNLGVDLDARLQRRNRCWRRRDGTRWQIAVVQ